MDPQLRFIPLDLLDPSPYQPRTDLGDLEDLARSIAQLGLLQPLVARPKEEGRYELLAGHRRLEALRRLGWSEAPVVVRPATEEEARQAVVHENEVRARLHPYDLARYVLANLQRVLGLDGEALWGLLSRLVKGKPTDPELARRAEETIRAYGISALSFYTHYRPLLLLHPEIPARLRRLGLKELKELYGWLLLWRDPLEGFLRYWVGSGGEVEDLVDPDVLIQRAFLRFLEAQPPGFDASDAPLRLARSRREHLLLSPFFRSLRSHLPSPQPGRLLRAAQLEEALHRAMERLWGEVASGVIPGVHENRIPSEALPLYREALDLEAELRSFLSDSLEPIKYLLLWESLVDPEEGGLEAFRREREVFLELMQGIARGYAGYVDRFLAKAVEEGRLPPRKAQRLWVALHRGHQGFLRGVERRAKNPRPVAEPEVVGFLGRAWSATRRLLREQGEKQVPLLPPPSLPLNEKMGALKHKLWKSEEPRRPGAEEPTHGNPEDLPREKPVQVWFLEEPGEPVEPFDPEEGA